MKKLSLKVLSFVVFGTLCVWGLFSLVNAQGSTTNTQGFWDQSTAWGIGVAGAGQEKGDTLITVFKTFINWMLGMLALIALVILLWGGFQMVTAAGDDAKYKKGFKILQQAAIGLVFIGISWLVVSVIFRLLGTVLGVA